MEGFAREHVQFCGNDTEPDFWSVLPRLEGSLYGVNIRAYADPWRVFGYDVLAHYFYSDEAKEDYSEGYTPANFSDDIYGNKYRKLHAYFQVSHMQHSPKSILKPAMAALPPSCLQLLVLNSK